MLASDTEKSCGMKGKESRFMDIKLTLMGTAPQLVTPLKLLTSLISCENNTKSVQLDLLQIKLISVITPKANALLID
jgi:hypothetical protein